MGVLYFDSGGIYDPRTRTGWGPLERLQNRALRILPGAIPSMPVPSLHVECYHAPPPSCPIPSLLFDREVALSARLPSGLFIQPSRWVCSPSPLLRPSSSPLHRDLRIGQPSRRPTGPAATLVLLLALLVRLDSTSPGAAPLSPGTDCWPSGASSSTPLGPRVKLARTPYSGHRWVPQRGPGHGGSGLLGRSLWELRPFSAAWVGDGVPGGGRRYPGGVPLCRPSWTFSRIRFSVRPDIAFIGTTVGPDSGRPDEGSPPALLSPG